VTHAVAQENMRFYPIGREIDSRATDNVKHQAPQP
jgi:hypothetical protein